MKKSNATPPEGRQTRWVAVDGAGDIARVTGVVSRSEDSDGGGESECLVRALLFCFF